MSDPQFDVERATAGLVLALFLAASLLVAVMFYFILRDTKKRAETSSSPQAVRVEPPPQSLYSNRNGMAANGSARRFRRSPASTMRCIACFARLEDDAQRSFSPDFLRLNTGSQTADAAPAPSPIPEVYA